MRTSNAQDSIWPVVRQWILRAICLAMLGQIVYSAIWMAKNFNTVPGFGDTAEYVELSRTMALDEYRPVLYPLILRGARAISEDNYFKYVYVLQTGMSWFCLSYAIFAIDTLFQRKPVWTMGNLARWLFGGIYLSSVPMITFMNFAILTDSLANSLCVLFLGISVQIIYGGKASAGKGVGLALAMIGQSLLRADRIYSGLLLLAILALIAIVRNRRQRKILLLGTVVIGIVAFGTVKIVGSMTQERGRNGRIETNLSFVLLDRVVWPHMSENYDYFPEEIRTNISLEEAQVFDQHNNNVMYQLAPTLESRVGKAQAEACYRQMARIVWERQSAVVLRDIGKSMLIALGTPIIHYLEMNGRPYTGAVIWNTHCMSQTTPELTQTFGNFAFYVLVFTLISGLLISLLDHLHGCGRKRPFILWPFIIESILLSLWFCLGDGAPLNNRYMLITYVTYALWPLAKVYGVQANKKVNHIG